MNLQEKKISSDNIFTGMVVTMQRDKVLLGTGKQAIREVVRHSGGVCVAAVDDENHIYLVRQFRYPYNEIVTELPAGKLNPGEDPLECGKRELLEETGLTADEYISLGVLYPSPGYLDEVIHMYYARGLSQGPQELDEDEFLDVIRIPLSKAVDMVHSGQLKDAKTQSAILKTEYVIRRNVGGI